MSTTTKNPSSPEGRAFFEQQRTLLIQDVAASMEQVLQNINKLNRSLEGVIAVGNEFSQVEGLWSQFENVMGAKAATTTATTTTAAAATTVTGGDSSSNREKEKEEEEKEEEEKEEEEKEEEEKEEEEKEEEENARKE